MYQPSPPLPEDTPNTSSAAISVRQAKAQPILRPVRMDGKAAGIRILVTRVMPRRPELRPTMRSVFDTDLNPECVLSATAHRSEWTSKNLMDPSPSQNE